MCTKFHANPTFWTITIMTPSRRSWKFNEKESIVKSPICTYTLSFFNIGLFLRKLDCWRNAQFTYDVAAAILNAIHFQFLNGHIYKGSLKTHGSRRVVRTNFRQKFKLAVSIILDVELKKWIKTPACIFMGYTLVKFGGDIFTVHWDTECDRRIDGRTHDGLDLQVFDQ